MFAMRQKVDFISNGLTLSGALEMPESAVRCYAVFAHCFTCGKDIAAASRISRALTASGIAVLRFDFTGLGSSDGDFSNTNFSSNLQDLLAAVEFMRNEYAAPELLIGHSLGGAAVLAMASEVDEVKAVVTIGAPHGAEHVKQNFRASLSEIDRTGEAQVALGDRQFLIKKQFLEDLVPIEEAEKIYVAARHPKSFVSLDDADHLLSRKRDSEYVATAIAAWASRYLTPEDETPRVTVTPGYVRVEEKDHKFTQHIWSDSHYWLADEPRAVGGNNTGPDPYEHLLAALGACTSMTLRMYATRKKMPLEHVVVELKHSRDYQKDCEGCEEQGAQIDVLAREITLQGSLSGEQRARLLEIADRCPVHRTLHNHLQVRTVLVGGAS